MSKSNFDAMLIMLLKWDKKSALPVGKRGANGIIV